MSIQVATVISVIVGIAGCVALFRALIQIPTQGGGYGTGMVYVFPPGFYGFMISLSMLGGWLLVRSTVGASVIIESLVMAGVALLVGIYGRKFLLSGIN